MDEHLLGCWRVKSIDMVENRCVSLIGGLPGQHVVFGEDGYYQVNIRQRLTSRPMANKGSRYRTATSEKFFELDIWIPDLEALVSRCIYQIQQDLLVICVGGNHGERPIELRRDDERLWCMITMEKAKIPRRRKQSPK